MSAARMRCTICHKLTPTARIQGAVCDDCGGRAEAARTATTCKACGASISLGEADRFDGDCIFCAASEQDRPESVLSEAARLVDGDRQTAYGHPRDNHACTADLWTAYLKRRAGGGPFYGELDAFDVCMLNILQKVSRLAHTRQRDGLVDIAGFARNAEMVDDERFPPPRDSGKRGC